MKEFLGTEAASNSQFIAEAVIDLYPRLCSVDQARYRKAYEAAVIEMDNFED